MKTRILLVLVIIALLASACGPAPERKSGGLVDVLDCLVWSSKNLDQLASGQIDPDTSPACARAHAK